MNVPFGVSSPVPRIQPKLIPENKMKKSKRKTIN